MQTYTEYRVTYGMIDGQPGECIITRDKQEALDYIECGVERAGLPRHLYGIQHRTVTVGDWHPTTMSAEA